MTDAMPLLKCKSLGDLKEESLSVPPAGVTESGQFPADLTSGRMCINVRGIFTGGDRIYRLVEFAACGTFVISREPLQVEDLQFRLGNRRADAEPTDRSLVSDSKPGLSIFILAPQCHSKGSPPGRRHEGDTFNGAVLIQPDREQDHVALFGRAPRLSFLRHAQQASNGWSSHARALSVSARDRFLLQFTRARPVPGCAGNHGEHRVTSGPPTWRRHRSAAGHDWQRALDHLSFPS